MDILGMGAMASRRKTFNPLKKIFGPGEVVVTEGKNGNAHIALQFSLAQVVLNPFGVMRQGKAFKAQMKRLQNPIVLNQSAAKYGVSPAEYAIGMAQATVKQASNPKTHVFHPFALQRAAQLTEQLYAMKPAARIRPRDFGL